MATAPTSLRPVLVSFPRKGRDEQHINAISKKGPVQQKRKIPSANIDLPLVLRERQSVPLVRQRRLANIVVPLPQVRSATLSLSRFPEPPRKLANAQISCCNIRHNRI